MFLVIFPLSLILLSCAEVLKDSCSVSTVVVILSFVDVSVFHVHFAMSFLFALLKGAFVELAGGEGVDSLAIHLVVFPVAEIAIAVLAVHDSLAGPLALRVMLADVLIAIFEFPPCYSGPEVALIIEDVLPLEDEVHFLSFLDELGLLFLGGHILVPLQHHDVDLAVPAHQGSPLRQDALGSARGSVRSGQRCLRHLL